MGTVNYLNNLMADKDILSQKTRFPLGKMDYDASQVRRFLEEQRLHDLIRLYKYAQKSIVELLCDNKTSFWQDFFNINRYREKSYEFWQKLQNDISCVRTRMMLEVLLRDENVKINRSGMTFAVCAAEDFCKRLTEEQYRLLLERVIYRCQVNEKALESYRTSNRKDVAMLKSYQEAWKFCNSVLRVMKK